MKAANFKKLLFVLGLFLLFVTSRVAKADKFKLDGRLESSFRLDEAFKEGQSNNELQINLKAKRKNRVKVSADVKLESESNLVSLREVKFDYKPSDSSKFIIGKQKKSTGYSYSFNQSERISILRPPLYEKLANLGLVGRQVGLTYLSKADSDREFESGMFSGEGLSYSALFSNSYIGENNRLFKMTLLFQGDRREGSWQSSGLVNFMLFAAFENYRYLLEVHGGLDSLASIQFGYHVYFGSFRLNFEYGSNFRVFTDLSVREDNFSESSLSIDSALGVKYYLNDQLYVGAQGVLVAKPQNRDLDDNSRSPSNFYSSRSLFYMSIRYYVD